MGKKNSDDIQVIMDTPVEMDSEVLESEAYQSPRPDVNVDATVLKTIGTGGPVPIVAPKRDTIQLQPIVVPLAVVPYMAQDGGSLRTDEAPKKQATEQSIKDESNEAAIKGKIEKIESRQRINKRVFSFIIFLISALTMIPFILANFYHELWNVNLVDINVIGQITAWVQGTAPFNLLVTITNIVTFGFAGLSVLLSLFGLIFGTFPHILNMVFAVFTVLPMAVQLIYKAIKNMFTIQNDAFGIAVLIIAVLLFAVDLIFIHVLNKEEDTIEDLNMEI